MIYFFIFYTLLLTFYLWFAIGNRKAFRTIRLTRDTLYEMLQIIHTLNERDVKNGFLNFEIRYKMYYSVPLSELYDVSIIKTLAFWNFPKDSLDIFTRWSDLRFIDPILNCDQLAKLVGDKYDSYT